MKILIAGLGGQGVQTIAKMLSEVAFEEGKETTYIPNFGVEQRGGFSLAFVIIDDKPIPYPKFQEADILGVLSSEAMSRVKDYRGEKTRVIENNNNLDLLKEIVSQTKIVSESKVEEAIQKKFHAS